MEGGEGGDKSARSQMIELIVMRAWSEVLCSRSETDIGGESANKAGKSSHLPPPCSQLATPHHIHRTQPGEELRTQPARFDMSYRKDMMRLMC